MTRDNKAEETFFYEIRVKGHLDYEWSEWFDNLSITHEPDGITMLTGPFVDQAALYGFLKWLNELCLPLISFKRIESDPDAAPKEGG